MFRVLGFIGFSVPMTGCHGVRCGALVFRFTPEVDRV